MAISTLGVSAAPVVTLSNGLRVANFSSPHPFNFVDGSVLPACAPDRVEAGALDRSDRERPFPGLSGVTAVQPTFRLTYRGDDMLYQLCRRSDVDIVLVPLPVVQALREQDKLDCVAYRKVATISVADRQTKAIHINRFCR